MFLANKHQQPRHRLKLIGGITAGMAFQFPKNLFHFAHERARFPRNVRGEFDQSLFDDSSDTHGSILHGKSVSVDLPAALPYRDGEDYGNTTRR